MGAFQEYARAAMAAGKKRGRRPTMNAQQFYPRGLERELQQKTVAEFMRIYGQFLEAALSGFSTFADEQLDLFESQPELSEKFKTELMEIARRTDSKAHENFSRQSEMIIGAPYYPPGTAEGVLNEWHATFQDLCKSACTQQKTRMALIVAGAKEAGWNRDQLEKAIEKELPSQFRHRAELIARTELGKLNSRVTLETYKSTGIQYYKWLTTIDGRERESHAEMNDRICSVSDGGVYFDQNPERPLHPVEHQRTGAMYHGHPGTDFQCRCSMVMWDPEIDGDYEVKDSDLLEERKAAEKAEKEAQERAEAERLVREQAEREKAAEAIKNAKDEARRAEAERLAAEKARMEAEKAARMSAEEARRARLEAAAVKRHAERTPDAASAIVSAWNRRRIMRIAEARHASRTPEQAAEIRKKWDARQAEIKDAIKKVAEIRKEYSGIKGMPFPSTVKKAENGAKYKNAAELAGKFRQKVDAEAAKMDLLDNPLESMKKHGLKETQAVQEAVRKKLESFGGLDIDQKINKLEFEIKWVENSKKYATWEVAKKAYEKALVAAKFQKAVDDATAKIQALETTAKSAKDKTLTGYVNKLKKAGTPTTQAELDALEKEIDKAEKRAAKVKPKEPSPSDVYPEISFKPSTAKQRSIPFIDSSKWRAKDAEIIDSCAKTAWQSATLEQKQAAYYYTKGSKVNNEPLYGANYSGPKSVREAVTKHNPNLTRLIDNTSLPKDTWLRSGQQLGTFSGVFGIDLEAEIKMLDNGKRSKDDIAKELTKKLKGKTGTQKAFMSTSFASNTGFKETLDFQIFAQKGTKCLYAEPFSKFGVRDTSPTKWDGKEDTISLGKAEEFEGILQRGTEFRINKITFDISKRTDSGWSIELEIVKQAPQPYRPGNPVIY